MPGRVGVSSDQAVHEKGERGDGASSPPRSGGDADSPGVDAASGVANPQRGLLHAMVSSPVAPSGLLAVSPTSTVGEKPKQRCGSEKPRIQAKGEDTSGAFTRVAARRDRTPVGRSTAAGGEGGSIAVIGGA